MTSKPRIPFAHVAAWLDERYDEPIEELAPVSGGYWSSAYTYRVGGEEFVLRLSDMAEGFAIDAAAMRFARAELPIPEVLDVGEALDRHYAISRRHHGRFVEDSWSGRAMSRLLEALRAVPSTPESAVAWHRPDDTTWHEWLRGGLVDHPESRVNGWRAKLEAQPRLDAIFRACEARIEELLPHCPERRDLVHGDLLHQNVLVAEDGARVTAVFSWKCSVRGDFLFDVAWCTFWAPWHPAIDADDLWRRTCEAPDLRDDARVDAVMRHHCYELQIAASHFGWYVWTDDDEQLATVARAAQRLLDQGPRDETG
ncbi:MAG: aminoglycoside phosphotransferase family protein [Planctomycetota bacterium]